MRFTCYERKRRYIYWLYEIIVPLYYMYINCWTCLHGWSSQSCRLIRLVLFLKKKKEVQNFKSSNFLVCVFWHVVILYASKVKSCGASSMHPSEINIEQIWEGMVLFSKVIFIGVCIGWIHFGVWSKILFFFYF